MKESKRLAVLKMSSIEETKATKKQKKDLRRLRPNVRGGSYNQKLQQAGIALPSFIYIPTVIAGGLFIMISLSNMVGPLVGGILGPSFAHYFLSTYLTARAEKRRREIVPDLPPFLDTLAASLGTGYGMEVAIEHASNSLPDGTLKVELKKIVRMLQKGIMLEEALALIVQRLAGQEIISVVITVQLFSDMGGRGLGPFKALGYKIREQQAVIERAGRDLVGTKQAFYVIFALSITAPLLLFASDKEYILSAFAHPWLKYVMQGAIVVQVMSFLMFKKFTTLRV